MPCKLLQGKLLHTGILGARLALQQAQSRLHDAAI